MIIRLLGKTFQFSLHLRDYLELFFVTSPFAKRLFGKNRSIIFPRGITRKIIYYYDGSPYQMVDEKTGNLGYGMTHYGLLTALKPKRILCVGSRGGFIPAICALACQENENGVVDFVDAGYEEDDKNSWGGNGFWKKINPQKFFSFLDVNKYLNLYVMTTREFANRYVFLYDYIYIDGNHSYRGVRLDYNLFWPRLRRGGLMVFHDVTVKKELGRSFGVHKFWKELHRHKGITLPFAISGLGIIQK